MESFPPTKGNHVHSDHSAQAHLARTKNHGEQPQHSYLTWVLFDEVITTKDEALRPKSCPALLILCLLLATCAFSQMDRQSPSALLRTLLSPDSSDEQWTSAKDQFQGLSAEDAILVLFPEMAKGIPGGFSYTPYNCSEPMHDRKVPVWGEYCIVHWLWCKRLTCSTHRGEVAAVLLELWTHPISRDGQMVLLNGLCGSLEAEENSAGLFRDDKADQGLRTQAAICLLQRLQSAKYHEEIVAFAQQNGPVKRDQLFRSLASPYHLADSGIDPAVVRMGFELMDEEAAKRHGQVASDYFEFIYANQLNKYLGTNFVPDSKLSIYLDREGIERWYHDSVANARSWWAIHRQEYATN